jgi:hypothetical protein
MIAGPAADLNPARDPADELGANGRAGVIDVALGHQTTRA